jgi:hypothetical protein
VVGRLVEQQQVGLAHHRAGQRHPLALAARQDLDRLGAIEPEARQDGVDAVRDRPALVVVDVGLECRGDRAARIEPRGELGLLREVGDPGGARAPDLAGVEGDLAGDYLEQRGLAGAVAADQADALAGFDGEVDPVEQRMVAEREFGRLDGQQAQAPALRARARVAGAGAAAFDAAAFDAAGFDAALAAAARAGLAAALFAAMRMRSALSLMKPPASAWL